MRNVGLPQYDVTFARNLSGAKLQWLQMSQLAQLGVASFAHQKEVMKAVRLLRTLTPRPSPNPNSNPTPHPSPNPSPDQVRLLLHAYARKEAVAHAMGQWDVLLGRTHARKEDRKQKKRSEAQEAMLLREAGAALNI